MKYEKGATLLVVLIMLVLLTLAVGMSFNAGRINTAIVGNQQAVQSTTDAARVAIDEVLSRPLFALSPSAPFDNPNGNEKLYDTDSSGTLNQNADIKVTITQSCIKNYTVLPKIEDPTAADSQGCVIGEGQNKGTEGAAADQKCADVIWELIADARDPVTEARTVATQGVRVRQLTAATTNTANYCP